MRCFRTPPGLSACYGVTGEKTARGTNRNGQGNGPTSGKIGIRKGKLLSQSNAGERGTKGKDD